MNFIENVRLAWAGLSSNKMRALLTMLGIIIGIASVIAILTVGSGMSGSVSNSMSALGVNNINVYLQIRSDNDSFVWVRYDEDDLITDDMLDALRERYPDAIEGIALSEQAGNGSVKKGELYANVTVTGINLDYLTVNGVNLIAGRDLLERDLSRYRAVAIVSDKLVNNMFGGDVSAAIGQQVVAYTDRSITAFTIVGVYEHENNSMDNTSETNINTEMYIPITKAKRLAHANDGYSSMTIAASSSVDSQTFATTITDFLNRYYTNNENFQVSSFSMESMVESMNEMLSTISIALAVIAGISLVVGGIGVMNIMLVSVTERTREIGTRKALGATNIQIQIQFVVESMIICLIGGAIGILLGGALGYAGSSMLGVGALPTIQSVVVSALFSLAIGLFFGYYPAGKAARLDPIEALRYE